MSKAAILGATGPTGFHLTAALRKSGTPVRVVARERGKLERLFPDAAVDKHPADVLDAHQTLRAIEGCDLVYDCIGLPGDQMHLHPVTARNIAQALERTKARCVQVSSYWAYYPQIHPTSSIRAAAARPGSSGGARPRTSCSPPAPPSCTCRTSTGPSCTPAPCRTRS
jgi:uncharacterized protein YbjT (DUF2867 family)